MEQAACLAISAVKKTWKNYGISPTCPYLTGKIVQTTFGLFGSSKIKVQSVKFRYLPLADGFL